MMNEITRVALESSAEVKFLPKLRSMSVRDGQMENHGSDRMEKFSNRSAKSFFMVRRICNALFGYPTEEDRIFTQLW